MLQTGAAMRVLISGASGLLGSALARALREANTKPLALVRPCRVRARCSGIRDSRSIRRSWRAAMPLCIWQAKISPDVWTEQFKREVLESRVSRHAHAGNGGELKVFGTRVSRRVFVCASGVGYYGNRGDEMLTEESAPGTGFLAEVCKQWEAATDPAREAGVRVVNLRIGVVLAKDGGALKPMLLPFQLGVGGRIGSGHQWWSWIEIEDVIGVMKLALQNGQLSGPVNVVGPSPVRNAEFVKALGKALHRPTIFPLPEFVVKSDFWRDGRRVAAHLGARCAGKAASRGI